MIKLYCEYLSARCIWLYVITMSRMTFRVNPHSIVCLNVKKLLAQSRHYIWSLPDSNGVWTHTHLVHKWTLNHSAKAVKWLSCVVSTYMYNALDCMLLSCHVRVSEFIFIYLYSLYFSLVLSSSAEIPSSSVTLQIYLTIRGSFLSSLITPSSIIDQVSLQYSVMLRTHV